MKYALLDWDNTLRKGYTLFSWIDYLIGKGIIKSGVREEIGYLIQEYQNDNISHDQLAKEACYVYAQSIKGISRFFLNQQVRKYMSEDEAKLFRFTKEIFNLLKQYRIQPIIISGAPEDVINNYRVALNINKIYGFATEENNGIFTGNVLYNYGYNKNKKVEEICNEFGNEPKIAFGDSVSDFEMLNRANKSIIVCKDGKKPNYHADGIIEHNMSSEDIRQVLIPMLSDF